MKKAYIYILKSFAGPMVMAFFIVLFILLMQFLWLRIDDIVGKGLGLSIIGEFVFWAIFVLIPMALPLSVLFASIMTMGNLGGNNELLALKSAGQSLTKILKPMFFVAFFVTIFAFYVSDNLLPYANLRIQSLFWDIRQKRPDVNIIPGQFCSLDDNVIKVASKDPKTNKMTDILFYQHPDFKGNVSVTIADSGYIKTEGDNMIITLYHGISYEEETDAHFNLESNTFGLQKRSFDKHTFVIDLSSNKLSRTDMDLFRGNYMMMKSKELNRTADSLGVIDKSNVNTFWKEYTDNATFENATELDTAKQIVEINDNQPIQHIDIDSAYRTFTPEEKERAITHAQEKIEFTLQHINYQINEIQNNQQNINKAKVEWHSKLTMSIACFIFFLVGAPLGAIIRKGGLGMPTVASLMLFIFYYILMTIFRKMAIQGVYPVVIAMWIPNAIFLPLGIFLMYKSTTDSALLDGDQYIKFIKRIFRVYDKGSYYMPNKISKVNLGKDILMQMLSDFEIQTNDLLSMANAKKLKYAQIVEYQNKYDELLGQLWGIQNEGLNEKLKDYPDLDIKTMKNNVPIIKRLTRKLFIKKLDKIVNTNRHINYIITKIKW